LGFGVRAELVVPVPIPIGIKRIAFVQGSCLKVMSCGHCQQRYAYQLNLEARGDDRDLLFMETLSGESEASAERARARAEENFLKQTQNVALPVPCPLCGWYQDDMLELVKEEAPINAPHVVAAVILALCWVPLVSSIPNSWLITAALAAIGLACLIWGYVLAFRFDPNAGDAEARKAIGRRNAVWGELLTKALASSAPPEKDIPASNGRPPPLPKPQG
jgi:hypothetical protein